MLADISDTEADSQVTSDIPEFVVDHCKRLLSVAGQKVCVVYGDIAHEDIALKTGSIINHAGIIRKQGEDHMCHQNSAILWRKSPKWYRLITGYALDEEIWVSHSWLQNPKGQIVETTYPFDLYYGVVLDPLESEKFCKHVLKEE